jgi:hypothetical protein
MSKPTTYIYLIVHETDISGAWTTPEEAVRFKFSHDIKEEGGIRFHFGAPLLTVEEAIEKMLEPNSDYPYLAKIKLNPDNDSEKWDLDR